ncbi:MAG: cytochrome P460 family protein [Nitrospinota bacterium]|nr:cytochrome P460 family protein [Nitrospinota bacterium]
MSRKLSILGLVFTLAGVAGFSLIAWAQPGQVDYPEGYRQWTHLKSMVIQKGHPLENPFQGIHHVYANPKAEKGLKSGNYENGSVFVFDLLKAQDAGSALAEGPRKLVGVMKKDKKQFQSTGGWGFEGFAGDSTTQRLVSDGGVGCYQCHTSQESKDFVFSTFRK